MKNTLFKLLILVWLVVITGLLNGQSKMNYLKVRDSVHTLSCAIINSDNIVFTYEQLSQIDESQIDTGLVEFYYDYGVALHYYGYVIKKDSTMLLKSIFYLLKSAELSEELKARSFDWIVWTYIYLKDYQKAKTYFELYLNCVKEDSKNESLIKIMEKYSKSN